MDGYHVFTSEDVRGLYVASKDPKKAFDQVAPTLAMLLERKLGAACEVLTAETFDEFMRRCRSDTRTPMPPTMGDRSYVVRCAA